MSPRSIILLAIVFGPYAYLAYYWYACFTTNCFLDGDMVLITMVAIVALPVLLVIFGAGFAARGARSLGHAAKAGRARDAVRGGVGFTLGLKLVLAGVPGCAILLYLALDTPEPGRDRLGRICEQTSYGERCRPDPSVDRPSELDRINAMRRRQQTN